MNRWIRYINTAILLLGCLFFGFLPVHAGEAEIKDGIYAGEVDLSGMTGQEAEEAINAYVSSLQEVELIFMAAADHPVSVTAGELGIAWSNPELVAEALEVGTRGNVIERYKILKDLQHENKVYPILISARAFLSTEIRM